MSTSQDAGPSSAAPIIAAIPSSRRKAPKPAVSLGLEDEVAFGSNEDLMDTVGEIVIPSANTWYPGKPDSPPPEKPKKKILELGSSSSAGSSTKSRPSLFGKDKVKSKGSGLGLGDARIISADEMAGRVGASTSDLSAPSLPSLVGGGGRRSRENSEYSGSSLRTSSSAMGLPGSRRQKVFGKIFGGSGKKRDDEVSVQGGSSLATDSVDSFGSVGRISESSSAPRSILITSAHVPPSHTPRSRTSTEPPSSLPSIPQTPFSVEPARLQSRRAGHKQEPSGSSSNAADPLMRSSARSMSNAESVNTFESFDPTSPTKATSNAPQMMAPEPDNEDDSIPDVPPQMQVTRNKSQQKHLSNVSGNSASSSGYTPSLSRPSVMSSVSSSIGTPTGRFPSDSMFEALLPNFPTAEIAIEGITILSTTVFRKMPTGSSDKKMFRPGNGGSSAFGQPKKATWQSHQLVLSAFRVNDGTPMPTPNPEGGRQRQPTDTRTVAHLHLFGQPSQKSPSRPTSTAVGFARKPTTPVEGIPRVEMDRKAIGPGTSAGVWENDDAEPGVAVGRKWVLRVGFEGEGEEWLCDMPTGDTLFEWVRQIKAHATVIKAETMGFGRAIRRAHAGGHEDLSLELELHEQGLKATPRQRNQSHFTDSHQQLQLQSDMYNDNGDFQPDLLCVDSPNGVSMRDFMTRKSLSPRGQDLATFLDNADLDWRMRQAEKSRIEREARGEAMSVSAGSNADAAKSMSRSRTPRVDDRPRDQRSPTKGGAMAPPGPPPSTRLPQPPIPPALAPAIPPPGPAPMNALPPTPSSKGSTPITPMPEMMYPVPPAVQIHSGSTGTDQSPEIKQEGYFDAVDEVDGLRKLSMEDARHGITGFAPPAPPSSAPPSSYAPSMVGDDGESISSKASSAARLRKRMQKQPALDLMAELSSRPEMNYDKPPEMREDLGVVIDENRPRKIRFG